MFNIPETLKFEADLIDRGILPTPRMAIIHNTYKCNQNCYYCFFKDYNYDGVTMPTTKLFSLLDDLAHFGLKSVQFCGGGEPLMCADMDKVFFHAYSLGLKTAMITNGVLLHGKTMESAVTNLTWVRIGIDTIDPVLYEKVRGVNQCNIVLENIKNAIKYKNKIKSNCEISIKINLFKEQTLQNIQDTFKYFKDLGIKSIQIKHVWDKEGNYYNKTINKESIGKLEAFGNTIVRKTEYKKYLHEPCWINPVQTTIDARGDVFLCCYYMGRDERHKIGNIFENKFKDIWGSPLHKDKIKNTNKKECLKHDCRFIKYMNVIRHNQKLGLWEFV